MLRPHYAALSFTQALELVPVGEEVEMLFVLPAMVDLYSDVVKKTANGPYTISPSRRWLSTWDSSGEIQNLLARRPSNGITAGSSLVTLLSNSEFWITTRTIASRQVLLWMESAVYA